MRRFFLFFLTMSCAAGMAQAAAPGGATLTSVSLKTMEARLPERVLSMRRVAAPVLGREDKRLAIHYEDDSAEPGESPARGSVFVLPVTQMAEVPASGATVRAQIALFDAMVDNLRRGTKLLGEGYHTGLARTSTLQVDRLVLACAAVTRQQAADQGSLKLVDRRCFFEVPGYVVGMSASTPFHGTEQPAREGQLAFIMAIARALVATPDAGLVSRREGG